MLLNALILGNYIEESVYKIRIRADIKDSIISEIKKV